ncbi:MAG: nickel-dependent lactate racemase [Gammaproteobacteria bacterium]|nr:nickel-dependent lactate racemase [Gammaproteobacteria bacterium]
MSGAGAVVELLYGRGTLPVRFPEACELTVVRKPAVAVLTDPAGVVTEAFADPVGAAPLRRLAAGCRTACILVCDITRPVPNGLFLRPMIEELLAAGVPSSGILVLVATGLHRPNEGAELERLIGDAWVSRNVRVENHFARNEGDHVDLGTTRGRGTPVKLDRRFVHADLRIATGLVEPHFMAGYSGGRKVVVPGVAHEDTIRTLHNHRLMAHPKAVQANLAGNPLHEEQLEIVRMLGDVYALNVVIDEERRPAFVNFGEIVESHLRAVDFAHGCCTVPLPRRFATIVTSAAGYPLDQTYYQTVKGMVTPMDVLEDGGTLIVASACTEGFGSRAFRAAQGHLVREGTDGFLERISGKPQAEIDEWQTQMQTKAQRSARVQLFTEGLDAEDFPLTGVERVASIRDAVSASIARTGDPAVAVVPEGPYVVPLRAA